MVAMEKRILIIDDEANMRHMLTALLTESGFIVDAVADGLMGLQKIEETLYHFIFCDIRMPNMDGMMLSAEIRKLHPNSKVVYMTAFSPADVVLRIPNETVLSKPFSTKYLCEKIRDTLFQCA